MDNSDVLKWLLELIIGGYLGWMFLLFVRQILVDFWRYINHDE
jgi:hypothetical protein